MKGKHVITLESEYFKNWQTWKYLHMNHKEFPYISQVLVIFKCLEQLIIGHFSINIGSGSVDLVKLVRFHENESPTGHPKLKNEFK